MSGELIALIALAVVIVVAMEYREYRRAAAAADARDKRIQQCRLACNIPVPGRDPVACAQICIGTA